MSTKNRYERGRLYLESIKRERGCVICGEQEVACLDFHHVDERDKSFNLTGFANTKSLTALRAEVDKCVVLCASCHRKVHGGLVEIPKGAFHAESTDEYRRHDGCGCVVRYDDESESPVHGAGSSQRGEDHEHR